MSLWWAVAFQRLLVLGLGLLAGCDATRTERLAIDIGGDGATIAAYREVEQGHASDTRRAFRVVRALGDRRRGDTLDLGVGSGRMWPTSFDVFVDPDGRFYFAAGTETATHLLTATSVDAVWSPVEIDPTIPVGPRAALAAPELFGHAWMDGGSLRLLVGRWDDAWLLRCAGGRVVEALPMDHGCSPIESIYGGPQCYVAVTDTGRVDALVDGWPSTATTSTLECSDVTCRWAPTTGVGLPAVDRFPDIRWEHRLLLHSSADELAFLNHLGFPHEVSVLGDDTEIRLRISRRRERRDRRDVNTRIAGT